MDRRICAVGLVALAVAATACAKKEVPIVDVQGDCSDVFGGQVCTWARTQGDSVIDAGATVPLAAIENAPAEEGEMVWPPKTIAELALPASVQDRTGLHQLTMYWEPTGHPPGPYLTPHFDFHFYSISNADRLAIDCSDAARPAALAAGYDLIDMPVPPPMIQMMGDTLRGLCVPEMGMHSLLDSELKSTGLFRGSMVLGYYRGNPIFVEPMLTKAMLLEKKSFDMPIPDIPGHAGEYPRQFRAQYDSTAQSYRFTFSRFAKGV